MDRKPGTLELSRDMFILTSHAERMCGNVQLANMDTIFSGNSAKMDTITLQIRFQYSVLYQFYVRTYWRARVVEPKEHEVVDRIYLHCLNRTVSIDAYFFSLSQHH